jgi:pyruvate/2-oxoglutarate dehydrogenase complex dihydrolipoamide dehydrogenase (E3) component
VANEWKSAVVKRMTDGVAYLFKVNGVTWVRGTGTFTDAHTLAVTGGENVTFTSAILATARRPGSADRRPQQETHSWHFGGSGSPGESGQYYPRRSSPLSRR